MQIFNKRTLKPSFYFVPDGAFCVGISIVHKYNGYRHQMRYAQTVYDLMMAGF